MEKKLGFGMMRLPENDSGVDVKRVCGMVDKYLERGYRWFDTAYLYHKGQSEGVVGASVVRRHPRESFQVATKMPVSTVKETADVQRIFDEQLTRTGLEYFDRYLLHAVDHAKLETIERTGMWDFLYGLKEKGLAKKIGFSFHDTAEVLEKILSAHPDLDFVQLQINYADWNNPGVQSAKNYAVAEKYGLNVIVMEPVKGGMLAGNLNPAVMEVLNAVTPGLDPAVWALRFAASLKNVVTVLSGMSTEAQLEQNMDLFDAFEQLNPAEQDALRQAAELLAQTKTIPCTRCGYCTENCPQQLPIPNLIAVLNDTLKFGMSDGTRHAFDWYARKGKPSNCVRCHRCEARCPQHLPIIESLAKLAEKYE